MTKTNFIVPIVLTVLAVGTAFFSHCNRSSQTPSANFDEVAAQLHASGVNVRIIPSMKNGAASGSCWLTLDPVDDWASIQLKVGNHLSSNNWSGSKIASAYSKSDPFSNIPDLNYGDTYYESSSFIFIGDPDLIDRIKNSVR